MKLLYKNMRLFLSMLLLSTFANMSFAMITPDFDKGSTSHPRPEISFNNEPKIQAEITYYLDSGKLYKKNTQPVYTKEIEMLQEFQSFRHKTLTIEKVHELINKFPSAPEIPENPSQKSSSTLKKPEIIKYYFIDYTLYSKKGFRLRFQNIENLKNFTITGGNPNNDEFLNDVDQKNLFDTTHEIDLSQEEEKKIKLKLEKKYEGEKVKAENPPKIHKFLELLCLNYSYKRSVQLGINYKILRAIEKEKKRQHRLMLVKKFMENYHS